MPKVRILSGNQKGAVVDLPRNEAEAAIDTGYGEAFVEPAVEPAPAKPAEKPKK